jgi:hypothetical protein
VPGTAHTRRHDVWRSLLGRRHDVWRSLLRGEWIGEHAGAGKATGQDSDELQRVDLDSFTVDALAELPTSRAFEHELERLGAEARPFSDDVGDQSAVVVGQ